MVIALLAIAGFFALICLQNTILARKQYDTYQQLAMVARSGGYREQRLGRISEVNLDGHSHIAAVVRDRIRSGDDLNNQGHVYIHLKGKRQFVYIVSDSLGDWGFVGRSWNVGTVGRTEGIVYAVIYWVLVLILLLWSARDDRHLQAEIRALADNIHRVRYDHQAHPLLVPPSSRVYPLAYQIQGLEGDVTHWRRKLTVRSERFVQLVDHLPQGVMLINGQRQVTIVNTAMATLLGHEISRDRHPYVDDIQTFALSHMIEHTARDAQSRHQELQLQDDTVDVDATTVAIRKGPDEIQVLVILYDVTFMRQVEKMQSDFVQNVSHELKTPVTAITGFAETLLAGAKDDPEALDKFLHIIQTESQRLTQLIQDTLALSRVGSSNDHIEKVPVAPLVQNALNSIQQPLKDRKLHVNVELDADLSLDTNRRKLSQIVRNLVNNAVFYNKEGGTVSIVGVRTNGGIRLQVSDTGVGIADDEQQRVFERFYRVDKARSRNSGGTGLGLAIVSELVADLGGSIHLASQLGVGSTFTVALPNAVASEHNQDN
ncbi:two component sensor transduction histidine kinase [Lacticaseibacillus thailandensis DSM 22698 = JCM 13996]|uniref:histidine kinase n=3 Tax=Lacticaseibacillus thailandensis TaxID=381741 RepID=A0A0R2CDI2_9LACO|nr:two component sensor transduction histidine kinase [Lacticaseibacillus thailandensis DSM 22698 = JCM 13996]